MAQAYVPIQTYTLTATATSVTFSNIPQNYNDLRIVVSGRDADTGTSSALITFNGDGTAANYVSRYLRNNGGTFANTTYSGTVGYINMTLVNGSDTTANVLGNSEAYVPNYTASINKSVSLESTAETNGSAVMQVLGAGVWKSNSAITSITLTPSVSPFAIGSTFTLYGIGAARASGGTITADSYYTYHTFTSSGTFTANEKITGAEVLCIAGGGGGGTTSAGGGGAGGLLYTPGQTLTAATSYTISIGAGGSSSNANGSNTSFGSLTATGGGGGAGSGQTPGNGGSGGGGNNIGSARGTGTSGQGNDGGYGVTDSVTYSRGGGGGGAGAVGTTATASIAGAGGIGSSTYSSWGYATSTGQLSGGIYYYAGGGGGGTNSGSYPAGSGGLGGGGAGAAGNIVNGTAATANTGGGGGGGSGNSGVGAAGGSGVVIVRYPN